MLNIKQKWKKLARQNDKANDNDKAGKDDRVIDDGLLQLSNDQDTAINSRDDDKDFCIANLNKSNRHKLQQLNAVAYNKDSNKLLNSIPNVVKHTCSSVFLL